MTINLAGLPDPRKRDASPAFANHRFQPEARSYPDHTGSHLDEPAKARANKQSLTLHHYCGESVA